MNAINLEAQPEVSLYWYVGYLASEPVSELYIQVYDYMLTFEDERTFIWPSKWSIPKTLFLMTRYLPFIDLSITASRTSG